VSGRAARAALSLCLALLAGALLLSGCGSSGDSSGSGETASTQATTEPGEAKPKVIVETAADGFNAAKVYREALPGVVTIRSIFNGAGGAAEGSGFVLNQDGEIVTNAHVVTDASGGSRSPPRKSSSNSPTATTSRQKSSASIRSPTSPCSKSNRTASTCTRWRSATTTKSRSASRWRRSAAPSVNSPRSRSGWSRPLNRSVKSLTQFLIEGAIQTDASINPGNSGGPLLDAHAQVLGINQQIETSSGANDGVGFAVPVSAINARFAQLEEDGTAEYAYIGVSTQALYPQLAEKLGLDTTYGGLLARVVPGGPAEKAGLEGGDQQLQFQAAEYTTGGDVVLQIDGQKVIQPDDLARLISNYRPGEEVTLTVLRDNKHEQVKVKLGKRPETISSG